jgi:hypothetical protein
MPFFVLRIDNVCTEKVRMLKWILAQSPNGTPLCCGQAIWTPSLGENIRIYWIDDKFVTARRIQKIRSLQGVNAFEELSGVRVTIYDPSWRYENDYINKIFLPIV